MEALKWDPEHPLALKYLKLAEVEARAFSKGLFSGFGGKGHDRAPKLHDGLADIAATLAIIPFQAKTAR